MKWAGAGLAAGVAISLWGPAGAAEAPRHAMAVADAADADSDPHWPIDPHAKCSVYNAHAGAGDTIAWSGACRNGKAAGPGTATYFAHGHMFQTLTASFADGMVEDGHVAISWADGSHYEGEERHGRFNGQGVLVSADGSRYDGLWEDDAYKGTRPAAAPIPAGSAQAAAQRPEQHVRPVSSTAATRPAPVRTANAESVQHDANDDAVAEPVPSASPAGHWAFLGNLLETSLVAVDGSTLTLSATDGDGITRTITRPDGSTQSSSFALLGERLGTVRDPRAPDEAIATFRISDAAIDIAYGDGRSERIAANPNGGLNVSDSTSDGKHFETAWYPQGHSFSRADRQAALAQYASRLDVGAADVGQASTPAGKHARSRKGHGQSHSARSENKAHSERSSVEPRPNRSDSLALMSGSANHATTLAADQPIVVRTSEVHPIDPPDGRRGSSGCLSVESDGRHWGFRNRCDTDIQFAYCLLDGTNPLTSCKEGGAAGSVAANGFGALMADDSLKDVDASRDFRWIACAGGAGEVAARLEHSDPPDGRCVHAQGGSLQEADASDDEDGN